jgi:hypothetical protein
MVVYSGSREWSVYKHESVVHLVLCLHKLLGKSASTVKCSLVEPLLYMPVMIL